MPFPLFSRANRTCLFWTIFSQKYRAFGKIGLSYAQSEFQQNCGGGGIHRKRIFHDIFSEIVSTQNILRAWLEFRRGKRSKPDVQNFEFNLESNLLKLQGEILSGSYEHEPYQSFRVRDPKLRHIHKASVRDRLLHQAIFRVLYPIFDKSFIFDSFSCRVGKGTHPAVSRLEKFLKKTGQNNHRPVYTLKCDVRKFFDSINHEKLLELIKRKVSCEKTIWLIEKIIDSFEKTKGAGLPLGNVTSQLFANIYLNELDQFIKRHLKVKYYLRYCDDFVILNSSQNALKNILEPIRSFSRQRLSLNLHENKIILRRHSQGVDFLGYVVLPYHRVLRTKTKRRIFKKIVLRGGELERGVISHDSFSQTLQSYFGVLSHCSGFKISEDLRAKSMVDKSGKSML